MSSSQTPLGSGFGPATTGGDVVRGLDLSGKVGWSPDHLRLVSTSDVFTPMGRTRIGVMWDLKVRKLDDKTCEFTSTVHSSATPELEDFLGKQGIPWEAFKAARKPVSEAYNRQETPLFAKSIERHELNRAARVDHASTLAFEKSLNDRCGPAEKWRESWTQ